jgi:hypothetical protein
MKQGGHGDDSRPGGPEANRLPQLLLLRRSDDVIRLLGRITPVVKELR